MVLEVYYGNTKKVNKRSFSNFNEANQFIRFNEQHMRLTLGEKLGNKIESKPRLEDELMRSVYQNAYGELRYYILTINEH